MNRRTFFAAIAAAFLKPKPAPQFWIDEDYVVNWRHTVEELRLTREQRLIGISRIFRIHVTGELA